jgi:hypothetical protein
MTVLKLLRRLDLAAYRGHKAQLSVADVKALVQLQGVQDEITDHERAAYPEEWYPPICYLPITGPAPDNELLNRCGLTTKGQTSFKCCTNCWCLRSSAGTELSLRSGCAVARSKP